jgi:hypothetical protein
LTFKALYWVQPACCLAWCRGIPASGHGAYWSVRPPGTTAGKTAPDKRPGDIRACSCRRRDLVAADHHAAIIDGRADSCPVAASFSEVHLPFGAVEPTCCYLPGTATLRSGELGYWKPMPRASARLMVLGVPYAILACGWILLGCVIYG